MAMFVRGANQFSPLFKEKTTCLCRKVFTIIDRKLILLTWVLDCLRLYNKQNITRRFEDMNFIFSW